MDNDRKLPLLYNELTPLSAERHGTLGIAKARDFSFARDTGFVPLTVDEFAQAQRFFPVVFTRESPATPVALFSAQQSSNDFVDEAGAWRAGAYVPGFLRRHPFHLVRKTAGDAERILCADTTSSALEEGVEDDDRKLFVDGAIGPGAERALTFCRAYDEATTRTQRMMAELEELGLFQEGAISAGIGGRKFRIDGFRVISEEKLQALDDETLLGLARRGVLAAVFAHVFSLANFTGMKLS